MQYSEICDTRRRNIVNHKTRATHSSSQSPRYLTEDYRGVNPPMTPFFSLTASLPHPSSRGLRKMLFPSSVVFLPLLFQFFYFYLRPIPSFCLSGDYKGGYPLYCSVALSLSPHLLFPKKLPERIAQSIDIMIISRSIIYS